MNLKHVDNVPLTQSLRELGIDETRRHWFGRGMLAGLMVAAALNAISYFEYPKVFRILSARRSHNKKRSGCDDDEHGRRADRLGYRRWRAAGQAV